MCPGTWAATHPAPGADTAVCEGSYPEVALRRLSHGIMMSTLCDGYSGDSSLWQLLVRFLLSLILKA